MTSAPGQSQMENWIKQDQGKMMILFFDRLKEFDQMLFGNSGLWYYEGK